MEQFEKIASYAFEYLPPSSDYNRMTPEQVSEEVDRLTQEHMRRTGQKDYSEAMRAVLNADIELKRAYAETDDIAEGFPGPILGKARTEPATVGRKRTPPLRREKTVAAAGAEVDEAVQRLLKDNPDMPYGDAMREVFKRNPSLRDRYHRGE